jgi:Flp pilus assembly protein TadG
MQGPEAGSMVEFALVLPFLVLCLCGIIDLGNLFYQFNLANEAAREGARYAATNKSSGSPPNQTSVQSLIQSEYGSYLTLTLTPNPPTSGSSVKATVTNSVTIMTPIISAFFPNNPYTVTGTTTMLVE